MIDLIIIEPLAKVDLKTTNEYYNREHPGLGIEFLQAFELKLNLIKQFPNMGLTVEKNIKRVLLNRFPYGIYYSIESNVIHVHGCLNLFQDPEALKHRTED